jgi:hypothetical protein
MHRREFLLSATGIVGATTVGSLAYTTASVERSVTSNIAADANAVIGLTAGGVSAVTQNTDGQLVVDTGTTDSDGLNSDATFEYGDTNAPSSTFAFSVTNNDGSQHTLTVGLTGMSSIPSGSSFTLKFYDSGDQHLGDATPNSDFSYSNWSSTETIYAVIQIDTTDATSSDDFSGTMTFSV